MIKDRFVRIKMVKRHPNQRPMSYVGKVTAFSENWVVVDGKGIMLNRHEQSGVQIDKISSAMMIPRESIESIRVLPDNFNVEKLSVNTNGQQLVLHVDGQRDAFIGELGEG